MVWSFTFCRVIVTLQIAHLHGGKEGFCSARQRWWFEYYKTPPGHADIPETYAIKTLYQFNQFRFIVSLYCAQLLWISFLPLNYHTSFLLSLIPMYAAMLMFLMAICIYIYIWAMSEFIPLLALFLNEVLLKSRTHLSASWCLLKMEDT